MVTFQLLWCICKSQAIPGDLPKHDLTGLASDSAEDATTLKGLMLLQKNRETNGKRDRDTDGRRAHHFQLGRGYILVQEYGDGKWEMCYLDSRRLYCRTPEK